MQQRNPSDMKEKYRLSQTKKKKGEGIYHHQNGLVRNAQKNSSNLNQKTIISNMKTYKSKKKKNFNKGKYIDKFKIP